MSDILKYSGLGFVEKTSHEEEAEKLAEEEIERISEIDYKWLNSEQLKKEKEEIEQEYGKKILDGSFKIFEDPDFQYKLITCEVQSYNSPPARVGFTEEMNDKIDNSEKLEQVFERYDNLLSHAVKNDCIIVREDIDSEHDKELVRLVDEGRSVLTLDEIQEQAEERERENKEEVNEIKMAN